MYDAFAAFLYVRTQDAAPADEYFATLEAPVHAVYSIGEIMIIYFQVLLRKKDARGTDDIVVTIAKLVFAVCDDSLARLLRDEQDAEHAYDKRVTSDAYESLSTNKIILNTLYYF